MALSSLPTWRTAITTAARCSPATCRWKEAGGVPDPYVPPEPVDHDSPDTRARDPIRPRKSPARNGGRTAVALDEFINQIEMRCQTIDEPQHHLPSSATCRRRHHYQRAAQHPLAGIQQLAGDGERAGSPYTADISNRQFYHQLTVSGRLTQDQARTVMSGSLKKTPMQDVVDAQQPGDQFRYEMAFLAIKFERNGDAVEALREHFNVSPEYMDRDLSGCGHVGKDEQPHGLVQGQPAARNCTHRTSFIVAGIYMVNLEARVSTLEVRGSPHFGSDR